MKFGSLFSGIEAASVAWRPLGWRCAWVAETDPFARALLAHRYPDVPNLGDVNRIDPDAIEPVDLVVFGSPCQSFSVAGKRRGMDAVKTAPELRGKLMWQAPCPGCGGCGIASCCEGALGLAADVPGER